MRMLDSPHINTLTQQLLKERSKPANLPRISPQRMLTSPTLIAQHRQIPIRKLPQARFHAPASTLFARG